MIGRLKNKLRSFFVKENPRKNGGWFGDYATWESALKDSSGYGQDSILKKVRESILKVKNGQAEYERDSVAFDKHEYSEDLLEALKLSVINNELNIIDFGGSLGSQYFQYRRFFKDVKINWMVVEQKHFVKCGNNEISSDDLKFFNTIEEALQYKKAEAILLSSVLPYVKAPFDLIKTVKGYGFHYIIIDRNPIIESGKDLLTVQEVPEFIYRASYPAWFFNEKKFLKAFTDEYEVKKEFGSPFSAPTIVNGAKASWKSFILVRK